MINVLVGICTFLSIIKISLGIYKDLLEIKKIKKTKDKKIKNKK